jgi:hypothetical protein
MDLFDYLWWIVIWFMGAIYGWYARERHSKRQVDMFMKKMDSVVHEEVSEHFIQINIEKHNDVLYIYNKETNTFMAQGKTKQEVEKILGDKFPNKKFLADAKNLKEMGF